MNAPFSRLVRPIVLVLLVGAVLVFGASNLAWATPLQSPLGQTVPSPTPSSTPEAQIPPGEEEDEDEDEDVRTPITPTTMSLIATPTMTPTMTVTPTTTLVPPAVPPAVPTVTPTIPVPAKLPVTGEPAAPALLPPFWFITVLLLIGLALIWTARRPSAKRNGDNVSPPDGPNGAP